MQTGGLVSFTAIVPGGQVWSQPSMHMKSLQRAVSEAYLFLLSQVFGGHRLLQGTTLSHSCSHCMAKKKCADCENTKN